MHKKKHKRPWPVFIVIMLAIGWGSWVGENAHFAGLSLYSVVDALGTVFLNALTVVVVPGVSSSTVTSNFPNW